MGTSVVQGHVSAGIELYCNDEKKRSRLRCKVCVLLFLLEKRFRRGLPGLRVCHTFFGTQPGGFASHGTVAVPASRDAVL